MNSRSIRHSVWVTSNRDLSSRRHQNQVVFSLKGTTSRTVLSPTS